MKVAEIVNTKLVASAVVLRRVSLGVKRQIRGLNVCRLYRENILVQEESRRFYKTNCLLNIVKGLHSFKLIFETRF